MSWLRLPHLQADEPQIVRSDDGEIAEVLIACRTKGQHEIPEVCCTAPRWLKNGTKTIRVRDRRLEPAPTWLLIQRQRLYDAKLAALVEFVAQKAAVHGWTPQLLRDLLVEPEAPKADKPKRGRKAKAQPEGEAQDDATADADA